MSKYDELDPKSELEQQIASDLETAFGKRGFEVEHFGDDEQHAPAGKPDIMMTHDLAIFNIEVTSSTGAAQDREFNSIRDHLDDVKGDNPGKDCYCIFASPQTSRRMIDSIKDHNFQRGDKPDLKIMPLSFDSLEMIVNKLSGSVADLYKPRIFIDIFSNYEDFIDDHRVRKLFVENVFSDDDELKEKIKQEEKERDQQLLEELINDLEKLEDYLREQGIATGEDAIDTLIYLVFIKLYEEQRFRDGIGDNRLNKDAFAKFKQNQRKEVRDKNKAIHELFDVIKSEREFTKSGMFGNRDQLPESLTDEFIIEELIPIFDKYNFLGTKIDALGAVYEVLALRANKDVKVGQFFTPENIVDFMVDIAELDPEDIVVDPACGTGRFLIWSMEDMCETIDNSSRRSRSAKKEELKENQLLGADIDDRIAKIAKMNMWIHGDGKSNILKSNGLKLHDSKLKDNKIEGNTDIILTNPPLGKLDYQAGYDDKFREEMKPVLPVKNSTKARLDTITQRIENHEEDLKEWKKEREELEKEEPVKEYKKLTENSKSDEERLSELEDDSSVKEYKKLNNKIERKKSKTIPDNEEEKKELEIQIKNNNSDFEITGKKRKGGALFIKFIYGLLEGKKGF